MAFEKIPIHNNFDLEKRKETLRKLCPTKSEYNLILEHIRGLANGTLTGKKISERRQVKIIDAFIFFYKNINKPSCKLSKEDLIDFKERLLNDSIKKENGFYKDKTKEDFTEIVARYLEFNYPEKVLSWKNNGVISFRKWFVIPSKRRTPEVLSEAEVEKLYAATKTIEGKAIISILFDSGARIEEFLNIRFEDIEQPTANFPYFKIDFKEEYSKTTGRIIGMYWKNSTEILGKYLQICEKKEPKARVFDMEYDAIRMFLSRLSRKTLNKNVNPHMLRKSSATYYADKLNRQQLCVRYGWKFSSEMPDVYISRAGVDEGKIKDNMFNSDLNAVQKENKELQTKYDLLRKDIENVVKRLIKAERVRAGK